MSAPLPASSTGGPAVAVTGQRRFPMPPAFLVRLIVTAAILALLWQMIDGSAAAARLLSADPIWLAAAFVLLHVQTFASALRWRLTAAQLGQRFGVGRAISEYYLAQLLNQTLPGGMLGDAGRAVRGRHPAGLLMAGQAVVIERLAGQVALYAVLLAALVVTAVMPGGPDWPGWAVGVVVWLGAGLLLAAALAAVVRGRSGPVLQGIARFLETARLGLCAPGVWQRQIVLNATTVACNLAAFAMCARATGTEMSFAMAVTVIPLILTMMVVPVSVSGWGLREGAAAALWPVFGATSDAGVAASVAFGLTVLAASLPGLVPLIAWRAGNRQGRPPDRTPSPNAPCVPTEDALVAQRSRYSFIDRSRRPR